MVKHGAAARVRSGEPSVPVIPPAQAGRRPWKSLPWQVGLAGGIVAHASQLRANNPIHTIPPERVRVEGYLKMIRGLADSLTVGGFGWAANRPRPVRRTMKSAKMIGPPEGTQESKAGLKAKKLIGRASYAFTQRLNYAFSSC